ncbi:MAG: DnaD domain-containing protein [Bacillaceae bacterium]|nr:DnaD domain-containing protein [Bacillaceae bacterium]
MERSLYQTLKENHTVLSHLLLKFYTRIGLSDQEMMLFIHLLAFKNEGKEFPTVEELGERMSAEGSRIISMIQRMVQKDYIKLEECFDEQKGVHYERYDLDPLYEKIAKAAYLAQLEQKEEPESEEKNLYTLFEQEFGRPLSPIECETLSLWVEQDKYNPELIESALREAVVSGKLNFRYIDRILFEWQRHNIRTAKEAREYSLRFRKYQRKEQKPATSTGTESGTASFPFFNWLDYDSES